MTDVRLNAEDEKTFVSVKNLLKEFGEKPVVNDDDDAAFLSVKQRLRKFDTRQDSNDCNNASAGNIRESIGSIGSPASSTSRKKFSHARSPTTKSMLVESLAANVTDSKSYPPVTMSSNNETDNPSSRSNHSLKENSSGTTEGFKYGDVMLKKVEKPVDYKFKGNTANEPDARISSYTRSSPENFRKRQPYNGEKKAGVPVQDRWKPTKKSEEDVSDPSKPVFATMKLRSVGAASSYNLRTPSYPDTSDGNKVSNLKKTFSSQIKLASNGESAEEEKVVGRRAPSGANEISHIRCTLKSSATELEELRKSLNSCTPVAKLIAERNKAAMANRSENRNVFGLPNDRRTSYGRPRSKSMGSALRRTKSMSSTQTKNSSSDGQPSHEQVRRDSVGSIEGFSNLCWEDFKASNPTGGGDIWDLNLDGSSFLDSQSNTRSCTALDELSGENHKGKILPSTSTISEYTTDSDACYFLDNYGHSSYIQITLSSGGIVEKFEPFVCMSTSDDSSTEYQSEYGMDLTIDPTYSDSKHSMRKALKGAKKFFLGKNLRKDTSFEA